MTLNYNIVPLGGSSLVEINGVRYSEGKNFIFWKNRGNLPINEVVVVFDKEHENIKSQDGRVIVSLKELNSYQDLANAINICRNIMGADVRFRFAVFNDNQRKLAEELGKNLGITYDIPQLTYNNNLKRGIGDNQENVAQKWQEVNKNKMSGENNLSASGSKTIEIDDDRGLRKVTVNDGKAYENVGSLSIDEKKASLLKKWQNDPVISSKLAGLTVEELDQMLMKEVTSNLKEYRMESADNFVANDKAEAVALNKAREEDGRVNDELGIVENNVSNRNQYSTVERENDELKVVNPNVVNAQVSAGGVSGSVTGNNQVQDSVDISEEQEQSREVENVFFLDEQYNIYDNDGNVLGKISENGYSIDFDNNCLVKNGQTIGSIGDYKDMGKSMVDSYTKPKVRVLEKQEDKSAAFVSLPVIMFILSALLLVTSIILLFVLG